MLTGGLVAPDEVGVTGADVHPYRSDQVTPRDGRFQAYC